MQDIRDVQKEINTVGATLSRSDAIADEKIFKVHMASIGLSI